MLNHALARRVKNLLYRRRGEPYRIAGRTLRYLPGSRPVRLAYLDSPNDNVRFDALQVDMLSRGIRSGDVVLDVGAHHGQYGILMAAFAGAAGTVVCFEPDPYARVMLERNVALNPDLRPPRVEVLALSDAAGEATLFSRGGNSQSSLARSGVEFGDDHGAESVRVQTETLDGYLARTNTSTPSWVKIDAEGAEIRILQGAVGLLAGSANVICELHPYAWTEFGTTFEELETLVASAGRRMVVLGTDRPVVAPAQYGSVLLARA